MMEDARIRWLLSAVIVVSVFTSLAFEFDGYLTPYIDQARFEKIVRAGKYVRDHGWEEPIYVSYGDPGIWFWSLDRSYFGQEAGLDYAFYGKIQDLYFLAPPLEESSYRVSPRTEHITAERNLAEITSRFGSDIRAVRQRPVVFLAPESYSFNISESFAPPYDVGGGIYIIPPNALTERVVNRWRLFCASDYIKISGGDTPITNWSIAPTVLESFDLPSQGTVQAVYRFGSSLNETYTADIHLMDYPTNYNSSVAYAPLSFYLDGVPVFQHSYGGAGPIWLRIFEGPLQPGMHTLEIQSGAPEMSSILTLDTIMIGPKL